MKLCERKATETATGKQTLLSGDVIADMCLSCFVHCVQELFKVMLRLATEHRQQLLVLSE